MRCELVASMLHNPRLVYPNEPTIGMDVVAKERIREFIRRVNSERGTTVILTTHDIGDIEQLCRRVLIIDRRTGLPLRVFHRHCRHAADDCDALLSVDSHLPFGLRTRDTRLVYCVV